MTKEAQQSVGHAVDGLVDDINTYRQVLGSFMTGVTIVTTLDKQGRKRGITANSFTSVSLDPPLVLFCVDYRAGSYETFQNTDGFVIHILASEQQDLARVFASKSEDKFADLETSEGHAGAPILQDVHAWLNCKLHDVVIAGDHAIIIGEVQSYQAAPARPLGFYQGRFFGFNTDQEISSMMSGTAQIHVGWMMQTLDGAIIAKRDADGALVLPSSRLKASEIHADGLTKRASELFKTDTSVEFLYSIYERANDQVTIIYRGQVFAEGADIDADFTCLKPADVSPSEFTSPGEEAVVDRYLEELANARFSVYAGSLAEGSIASVSDVKPDDRTGPRTGN